MNQPSPPDDPGLWFVLFNEIGILAQLSRALFEARLPQGFLVSHFAVLNHLIRVRDGRTPLDLARAFQVPKTTMTHTLTILERHGLIRLTANPQDGRSKCVWLTDAGRSFRATAIAGLAPDIAVLARQVPADQVAAILPALLALRQVMDRQRDG